MDDDDDTITPPSYENDNNNDNNKSTTTTSKSSATATNDDDDDENNKHSTPNSPTTTQIEAALYLTTFFLTSSFTLSVLSSYDCTLLHLTLPSSSSSSATTPPLNTLFSSNDDKHPLYLGLWSFSSPFNPGECLFYNVARESRVTVETDFYIKGGGLLFNGDLMWGLARLGGFLALVMGFLCNIMAWHMVYSKSILYQKSFLSLQILTLVLEGLKLMCFMNIQFCSQPLFLTNNSDPNSPIYEPAERCSWSRASFACLIALCQYLICLVITFVKLFAVRNSIGKSYSNLTLPSMGGSERSVTGRPNDNAGNNAGGNAGGGGGGGGGVGSSFTSRNNNDPSAKRDINQLRGAMSMMGFSTAAGFDVGGMSDDEDDVVEEKEEENKPLALENRRRARKKNMMQERDQQKKNELSNELAPLRRSSAMEDELWLDDTVCSQGRNVRFSASTKK